MRKKYKIKPSLPKRDHIFYGLLDDNCWGCRTRHACNNCKTARIYVEKHHTKYKGGLE